MLRTPRTTEESARPYLEYRPSHGAPPRLILLEALPFRLGRSSAAHFVIYSAQVSKEHAEIVYVADQLQIRDLHSTNGTFINGQRISNGLLVHDDIIHIANEEFRFVSESPNTPLTGDGPCSTEVAAELIPTSAFRSTQYLQELLTHHQVRMLFQPIVEFETLQVLGYEALARGTHTELSCKPMELFRLADECGLASALSQLSRALALEEAEALPAQGYLFLNLHPAEIGDPALLDSFRTLQAHQQQRIVLEVNEHAVTDLATMQLLCAQARELGIRIAYDDFGAGQRASWNSPRRRPISSSWICASCGASNRPRRGAIWWRH